MSYPPAVWCPIDGMIIMWYVCHEEFLTTKGTKVLPGAMIRFHEGASFVDVKIVGHMSGSAGYNWETEEINYETELKRFTTKQGRAIAVSGDRFLVKDTLSKTFTEKSIANLRFAT